MRSVQPPQTLVFAVFSHAFTLCPAGRDRLFVCGAFAAEPSQMESLSATAHDDHDGGRKLRTAKNVINPCAEERGITSLFRWAQVQYWVKVGKTEDDVKKALKLEKLTGRDLKTNSKYKYYEAFLLNTGVLTKDRPALSKIARAVLGTSKPLNEAENFQVNKWLDDRLPTFEVWKELRLSAMPDAERVSSDAFNLYVQFATKYDEQIYRSLEEGGKPLLVIGGNSAEEMYVKTQIWAVRGRPWHYVKKLLGMKSISKSDPHYKYYKQYIHWVVELSAPRRV